ncbi:MG2 domain-containing protein, partial [Rhodopirellula bahusiensis]
MAAEPKQDASWRKQQFEAAQQALQKGLPKTAIKHYDAIVPAAIAEEDHDDAILAMGMRASLRGQLDGGGAEDRILHLQQDMESAPEASKPLLRAVLASWFYSYQQQNQWRFRNRTEIESREDDSTPIKSGEDLKTWSAQRIIRHSSVLFDEALEDAETLQSTDLESIQRLITEGNAPESYRPTVYDFLVNQAIDHFVDAQSIYSGPIERFELEASSPILDPISDFLAWEIPETDLESPLRRATELMQDWVRFRQSNADEQNDAFLDANWNRLRFAEQNAVGSEKEERSKTAMQRFLSENQSHPISARASFQLAQQEMGKEEFVRAHQIAKTAAAAHPESFGGRQCAALIEQIEAPQLNIATERVWNLTLDESAQAEIEISYKNITEVHFKLVTLDFERLLESGQMVQNNEHEWLKKFGEEPAAREWSVDLEETSDFQTNVHRMDVPDDIAKGSYLLIASVNDDFVWKHNYLAGKQVWVSELALVTDGRWNQGTLEGHVLDSNTGEPISQATVAVWTWTNEGQPRNAFNNGYRYRSLLSLTTDQDGRFELKAKNGSNLNNLLLLAQNGKDRLPSQQHHSIRHSRTSNQLSGRTVFFTDRAIYRPGQTLRFKAIATSYDQSKNLYQTHNQKSLQVQLLDPNNQVVETLDLVTNDRGSCH